MAAPVLLTSWNDSLTDMARSGLTTSWKGNAEPAVDSTQIPDTAPDSVPGDILRNADPDSGIPLDVIVLTFRQGVSPAQKGQIVGSVRGAVIGGVRIDPRTGVDGAYLIRIPVTADINALDAVVQRLRALPAVVSASMFTRLKSEAERHPTMRRSQKTPQ